MNGKTGIACIVLTIAASVQAAPLPISSYSYNSNPSGSYPDSGGVELTDGVTNNVAWGTGVGIGYADVAGLVGWHYSNPSITFHFASPQIVQQVVVWAADSDGYAGVALPSSITLTTAGGFSQSFAIINPSGNGHTVPLTLSGFEFTSDHFTVIATPTSVWTMLSEVQAYDTPEPASLTLLAAGGFVLVSRRRGR